MSVRPSGACAVAAEPTPRAVPWRPAWTPDGSQIAFQRGEIYVLDLATGLERRLTAVTETGPTAFDTDPQWSSDRREIQDRVVRCEGVRRSAARAA